MTARERKRSKAKPAAAATPQSAATGRRRASAGNESLSTFFAVVVAVMVKVAWLSPLIVAAPYVAHRWKKRPSAATFRRWGITVLVTTALATVFAPRHAFDSVLFGHGVPQHVDAWMHGDAGAPLGARFMLVALAAYLAGTVASVGFGGVVVAAVVLAINAVTAVYLCASGYNVVQMAIVAVSPWQWCFLVGLWFLFEPLASLARQRTIRDRRALVTGAVLVAAAFLVRFVAAGAYAALVRRWTTY